MVGAAGSGLKMKDWDKVLEQSDDDELGHAEQSDDDDSSGEDD